MNQIKNNKIKVIYPFIFGITSLFFNSCNNDTISIVEEEEVAIVDDTDFEATDWTAETSVRQQTQILMKYLKIM